MLQTDIDGVPLQESQQPIRPTNEVPETLQQFGQTVKTFADVTKQDKASQTNRALSAAALANQQLKLDEATSELIQQDRLDPALADIIKTGDIKAKIAAIDKAQANGLNNQRSVGLKRTVLLQSYIRQHPEIDPRAFSKSMNVSLAAEQTTSASVREQEQKELDEQYTIAKDAADQFGINILGYDKQTAIEMVSTHPMVTVEARIKKLDQRARFNDATRAASQRDAELAATGGQIAHIQALHDVYPMLVERANGNALEVNPQVAVASLLTAANRAKAQIDAQYGDWPTVAKQKKDEIDAHVASLRPIVDGTTLGKGISNENAEFARRVMNPLNEARANMTLDLDDQKIVMNQQEMIRRDLNNTQSIMNMVPNAIKVKNALREGKILGFDQTFLDQGQRALEEGLESTSLFLKHTREGQQNALLRMFNEEAAKGRSKADVITGQLTLLAADALSPEDAPLLVQGLSDWYKFATDNEKREVSEALIQGARNPRVAELYGSSPTFRRLLPEVETEVTNQLSESFRPMLDNLADRSVFGLDFGSGNIVEFWTNVSPLITVDLEHLDKTGDIQYRLRDNAYKSANASDIRAVSEELTEINRNISGRFDAAMKAATAIGNFDKPSQALESMLRQNPGMSGMIQSPIQDEDVFRLTDKFIDSGVSPDLLDATIDSLIPEFLQRKVKDARDKRFKEREAEAERAQREAGS